MKQQGFQNGYKAESPTEINIERFMEMDEGNEECHLPCSSITLLISLGFIFILIGISSLVSNYQQNIVQMKLTQNGSTLSTVSTYLSFSSDSTLQIYLKIQKLTQFDYFISDPNHQIDFFKTNTPICANFKYNKDLSKKNGLNGSSLNPDDFAIPCGLFPGMFPQGVITMTLNNKTNITLDQSDLTYFPYQPDYQKIDQTKAWVNISDPFFQAWMSQNAIITTTKLIGKLVGNFQGYFTMNIQLNNPLPLQLDKASIILSTNKAFGSSDISFCLTNFCQSGILFFFAFVVYFYNKVLNQEIKKNQIQTHELQLKSSSEAVSVKAGDI